MTTSHVDERVCYGTLASLRADILLQVWEDGREASPGERGLMLLRVAVPALADDELASLSVGLRDSLLLDLFGRLFGNTAQALSACPGCGEQLEFDVSLPDIRVAAPPGRADRYSLVQNGQTIVYRLPSAGDLAALGAGSRDVGATSGALARRCVLALDDADGTAIDAAMPHELLAELEAAIATRVAEADPQAVVTLSFDCPSCTTHWRAPFDIVEFLWRRLDVFARDLLHDIHLLASHYGWAERDIIALSWRRRHYIELIGGVSAR
jgi:hypothetical protein